MIDLFISLLGIPYYLFKYLSEYHKNARSERRIAEKEQKTRYERALWEQSVIDKALEERIRREVSSPMELAKYRSEIIRSTKDMGISYGENIFDVCSTGWLKNFASNEMIVRILMANRGKLTEKDAQLGISVEHKKNGESQAFEIREKGKLVWWINKQLREHGINEDLLAVACGTIYPVRDENVCNGHFAGVYKWMPMIHVADRISIKDFN